MSVLYSQSITTRPQLECYMVTLESKKKIISHHSNMKSKPSVNAKIPLLTITKPLEITRHKVMALFLPQVDLFGRPPLRHLQVLGELKRKCPCHCHLSHIGTVFSNVWFSHFEVLK